MRQFFGWTILAVMLLSSVALAQTDVTITPIDNEVTVGQQATFRVVMKNNQDVAQRYAVFSLQTGQGWAVDPISLNDKVIELQAGQSYTTIVGARLIKELPLGIYYIPIAIEGDQEDKFSESLKVYVGREDLENYVPSLKVTVDMDERIDPRRPLSVKLFLENKNKLDLNSLTVRMRSELAEFDKEMTIDLPGLSKKTVEFAVVPHPYTQPKNYVLIFEFEHKGKVAKTMDQQVEVMVLDGPFNVSSSAQTVFLREYGTLIVTNNGNVLNEQQVRFPVSWFQSIVRSREAEEFKFNGQRYLSVSYIINYRWVLYGLIVLVLIILFVVLVRSPIGIRKNAVTLRSDEEGALSQLKITLDVSNKTDKPIRNITVVDVVPGIVNIEKSLDLGTLRPHEIKHTAGGTTVAWSISELDAHEDRLITYKVRAKLNVLGGFGLPRAYVEYTKGKGWRRKAYSNPFQLR